MRRTNNLRYFKDGFRLTLRLWALLSMSIVAFAIFASLLNLAGVSDDRSIVLSFCVTIIFALTAVPFLGYRKSINAEKRQRDLDHLSVRHVVRRLGLTFAGAPVYDLIVDVMRILGIAGLASFVFLQHSAREVLTDTIFGVSLFFVVFHAFIYPFIRTESVWEKEYKYRKLLITNAINTLATASVNGIDSPTLKNIELVALRAIKSFLEFAVLDKKRNHFHVNLIIEHPFDRNKLICIQRTNPTPSKSIPTLYDKEDMPTALKVIRERTPVYVSHFIPSINLEAEYQMVWQIPIDLRLGDQGNSVGILAIDSTKPHHLDLDDNREALLFNLTPYFALIRFSLIQRYLHGIWEDVIDTRGRDPHPHLRSLSAEERETHKTHVENASILDRNLDKESFDLVFQHFGSGVEQISRMRRLAGDLSQATTGRKVFGTLFPYLENNNRRIHG